MIPVVGALCFVLPWMTGARAAEPVALFGLETDDGGFQVGGDLGEWEWGAVEAGPGASWNGENAWSTSLAGDYYPESTETLTLVLPSTEGTARPMLKLMSWYAFGTGDGGWVEIDDGSGWQMIVPVYGYPVQEGWTGASTGWEEVVVDLGAYGTTPRVRLVFVANEDTSRGDGWFVDDVGLYDGDVAAPHLTELTELTDTMDVLGPYPVDVLANDDSGVAQVLLIWSTDTGLSGEQAMVAGEASRWSGSIPGVDPGTVVSYRVEADDGAQTARLPNTDRSFRVYLPAPTNVEAPAGRVLAQSASLRWRAPSAPYAIASYGIYRGDEAVAEVSPEDDDADGWISGMVPLEGTEDRFTVRARFSAGDTVVEGDASEEVSVQAAVPEVRTVSPDRAYAGDTVRLTVIGSFLLFSAGEVEAELGAGVTVSEVEVQDVDTARLTLLVSADAETGPRTLTLRTPSGTVEAEGVFEILPETDRPRLVDVSPTTITQGETGTLTLGWSGELGEPLTVSLGEGVVVESVTRAASLEVRYACLSNAPIGAHAVTVDDGTRILDGVSVEVEDKLITVPSCGIGVSPRWVLALAGLALLRRR